MAIAPFISAQSIVLFAQANRRAGAEQLVVLQVAANEGKIFTLRLLQEAVVGHHPGKHRAVNTPGLQILNHAIRP